MQRERAEPPRLADRGLLAVGFLALTTAVVVAHTSPATGYELSPYTETPVAFWAGLGTALLVSLFVSLRATADWFRRLALLLGGLAATSFVGLPLLRGYHFFSGGDALTHLGWARGIRLGNFQPTELIYPALHVNSAMFDAAFGIDTAHAILLLVVTVASLFVVFVTLSASVVAENRYATVVAAFSAFLFLPVTLIATHMLPHAMSQAIMVSSLVVFLLLKYVRRPEIPRAPSALGAVFAISSSLLVLYHPQLVAHLLAVFLGICVMQALYRRYRADHPVASHRPIYAQTAVMTVAFALWVANREFVASVVEFTVTSAADFFYGQGAAAAGIASQGASLVRIGGSITEVFLKLFGASLVYVVLAGLLVLWTVWESDETVERTTGGTVSYFAVALSGLLFVFALYFFGSVSEMYFRVFGLMMVLVTVLGAVALAHGMSSLSRRRSRSVVHGVAVVGLGILLVASLLTVFPSPYVYQPSAHVTESSMSGHATAFEHEQAGVGYLGIRAGPERYRDAWNAQGRKTSRYGAVTGEDIDAGLADRVDEDTYLTLTRADREREVVAYRELRYEREQIDSIAGQPGVSRVQSNGGFELFYVRAESD